MIKARPSRVNVCAVIFGLIVLAFVYLVIDQRINHIKGPDIFIPEKKRPNNARHGEVGIASIDSLIGRTTNG